MKKSPLKRKTPLKRGNGLRRTSGLSKRSRGQNASKTRQSEADLQREYGIPPTPSGRAQKLRWKGIRGIVWYWLSVYTRKRDAAKYGKCISCDFHSSDWRDYDAGHYIAVSRSPGMCFEEKGINAQCKRCNSPIWTPDASIPYGKELNRRFQYNIADELYERSWIITPLPGEIELRRLATHYKELANKQWDELILDV